MTPFWRRVTWWMHRRRREDELREELEFHLAEEAAERRAEGLSEDAARWAARRHVGSITLVREDTRALWTSRFLEQLAQDVRYGLRGMFRNRAFTALAVLSLALGIGGNTAIYSFMDAILLRSLPVADPASLVVVKWRSAPVDFGARRPGEPSRFVLHSIDGNTYSDSAGLTAAIFPFPAFERLRQASLPVLSSVFAYFPARRINVLLDRQADVVDGLWVSGEFFRGLGVAAAAGRVLLPEDDRAGAAPTAVISMGYSQRHFANPTEAVGRSVVVNNVPYTVVGVAAPEFFGVDPGARPQVYLPLHGKGDESTYLAQNDYWLQMMGRLRPGVSLAQAQAALAVPFQQWVASTATNNLERANLPQLRLEDGAEGLDSLRRRYSKPLYVLLAMVGLLLAIACTNTANLLLARGTARRAEIALRLSLGAGRFRIVRQLVTESIVLATLGGIAGVLIGFAGMRMLTRMLASGQDGFTLDAEVNQRVLLATLGISALCGVVFGLAPALRSTRLALLPALKDVRGGERQTRGRGGRLHLGATQALVVVQIALSLVLLVGAALFVRTLSNLQSVALGFNRENLLLFDINAQQAGYPPTAVATLYGDLRRQLSEMPGVRGATLSHASLIRAGRQLDLAVNGVPAHGTRVLGTGTAFFPTMQIPIAHGRGLDDRDAAGARPVAVVSELFSKSYFGDEIPLGRHITLRGRQAVEFEVVGVAANARYGGLRGTIPPVVYLPYAQVTFPPLAQMTYAVRTEMDPLSIVDSVREMVRQADSRLPITNIKTQNAEIDQSINQEIVFARLCSVFALLALIIACIGLYGTMMYSVARRTAEIGVRMALGAQRGTVVWMILREVCVMAAAGLAVSVPVILATSRLVESFLFDMTPADPAALAGAVAILLAAALIAGYVPARHASRIVPMMALRQE